MRLGSLQCSAVRATLVGGLVYVSWAAGMAQAQTPGYQGPVGVPAAPQPQLSFPTPPAITPNGKVVEDVIVRVNDQIISRSDVQRSEQQLEQELQQSGASPTDAAERQKDMLRDMIDQQLLLSKAKELGLNADAEVIRRLDEIRKQNHLDSMEALEKAAQQQGVSFEDFKAGIRNNILTQQVVRDEVGRKLQLTQGQEQSFYDAHKNEFSQPEQVRLSEILVPLPADANAAAVAQAQEKASSIESKIKGGGKFEEIAKADSGGPTASQGGDLGLFKRGALAKVLEDRTFDLRPGEATAPIRTRQGFVILKVTEHQAAGVPPLKDVEPQIQEAMYMQAMQPALRAYLTKLRENAYVDLRPGYVDTGASSKQTKPVFTAYAAPVPKKKKAAQRKAERSKGFVPAKVGTGAEAEAPVQTASSNGRLSGIRTVSAKKRKKIKKEKVRFGQAPRNALPAGNDQIGAGLDTGEGATSAAVTPGGTMEAGATAPGTAIAPIDSSNQVAVADVDPLAPVAPVKKKTRYSSEAKGISISKAAKKMAGIQEKQQAKPVAMTSEEQATAQTQAGPLGLNGDTAKKKKSVKVKGAKKARLQQKAPEPPKAPLEPTPYRTSPAAKPAQPSADSTTLPPASAPAPGAPAQGDTTPATPNTPIPTPPPF